MRKRLRSACFPAALVCGIAGGCAAQAPTATQEPTPPPSDLQAPNQPVPVTMTCGEFKALLKAGDKRTVGTAVLWLDGYYSGRSGLAELPAGWLRTVGQGVGGLARSVSTSAVLCLTLSASSIESTAAEIKRCVV